MYFVFGHFHLSEFVSIISIDRNDFEVNEAQISPENACGISILEAWSKWKWDANLFLGWTRRDWSSWGRGNAGYAWRRRTSWTLWNWWLQRYRWSYGWAWSTRISRLVAYIISANENFTTSFEKRSTSTSLFLHSQYLAFVRFEVNGNIKWCVIPFYW